jgi:hypothetical protein
MDHNRIMLTAKNEFCIIDYPVYSLMFLLSTDNSGMFALKKIQIMLKYRAPPKRAILRFLRETGDRGFSPGFLGLSQSVPRPRFFEKSGSNGNPYWVILVKIKNLKKSQNCSFLGHTVLKTLPNPLLLAFLHHALYVTYLVEISIIEHLHV